MFSRIVHILFKIFFGVKEIHSKDLGKPKKILIIRQHNQLGDLLAGTPLLRAIKETYPACHITFIPSPQNKNAVTKNKHIDRIVLFDKNIIFKPKKLIRFLKVLREGYDVVMVPVVVSISFTSNLLARIAKANIRVGASELDGKVNQSAYFFNRRIELDWRRFPDMNIADKSVDFVRPFNIITNDYRVEISFDKSDERSADDFILSMPGKGREFLIGLHTGAGKPPNRWYYRNFIELIDKMNERYDANFYLTGSSSDKEILDSISSELPCKIPLFLNRSIPEVAALIDKSDLFITNDTGIMHTAGSVSTPQISLFGPTNPFVWAPLGKYKFFIRKSDIIDDISVDDVLEIADNILSKQQKVHKIA